MTGPDATGRDGFRVQAPRRLLDPAGLDAVQLRRLGLSSDDFTVVLPGDAVARAVAAGRLVLTDEEGAAVADLLVDPEVVAAPVGPDGASGPFGPVDPVGSEVVAGAVGPFGPVGPVGPEVVAAPVAPDGASGRALADRVLAGRLVPRGEVTHGVARYAWRTPDRLRAELGGAAPGTVAVTDRPLLRADAARLPGEPGVILVTVGHGATGPFPPLGVWQAVTAWAGEFKPSWRVVPVPLGARGDPAVDAAARSAVDAAARVAVARAYGAQRVVDLAGASSGASQELLRRLDAGTDLDDLAGAAAAAVLRGLRPPVHRRGLVLLFTGLSGSGKSTIARGVRDALQDGGGRTVTMLDGDVVRRLLSAGLGYSRADRELNVRRIAWVAAEVARHGGVAVCAPIAPFAATRDEARRMAAEAGAHFVLVWVATPLAECERRDRKGLYALARAGKLAEFTGVTSPYEDPDDADLVLDTTGLDAGTAVRRVLDLLDRRGIMRPPTDRA